VGTRGRGIGRGALDGGQPHLRTGT
jgi:hypothetical protein